MENWSYDNMKQTKLWLDPNPYVMAWVPDTRVNKVLTMEDKDDD